MNEISDRALAIAERVEAFVRGTVFPYEKDPRRDHHGAPTDELVMEMREHARAAGVLTPHILGDGDHLGGCRREGQSRLRAGGRDDSETRSGTIPKLDLGRFAK